jgi:hypothetical protein
MGLKSRDSVERLIKSGQLRSVKLRKRRMVVAQSVKDLIAKLAEEEYRATRQRSPKELAQAAAVGAAVDAAQEPAPEAA